MTAIYYVRLEPARHTEMRFQRGQSVVGFAIVTPALIFFVFGSFVVETIMSDQMTAGYADA